jgi:hypothetical protein
MVDFRVETRDEPALWAAVGSHEVFRERARYNPNEEPDLWIEYENVATDQIYTCRLEAFLARFRSIPNGR